MSTERKISIATGVLFIVATLAALGANALDPSLTGTDHLAEVAAHGGAMTGAILLYLVAAVTSVGIAIALYPVLKNAGAGLALGAVVFRAIEAVFYTVAVVSLLSLLDLSRQIAAGSDQTTLAPLADLVLGMRDYSNVVAIITFSLGASMYYTLFFRSRLVPRWLSTWGAAGALLMLIASLLALTSGAPVTGYTLLILPILLQELVLAVWLLVKGFTPASVPVTAVPAVSAPTAAGTRQP